jgi:hypothetical protein
MRMLLLMIGTVLSWPALAALNAPANPPSALFCQPLVYRDRVLGIGYQAVIRAAPGCQRPALVRKENVFTGSAEAPVLIPVGEVRRVWLFTHRLTYTLEGQTWRRAVIR